MTNTPVALVLRNAGFSGQALDRACSNLNGIDVFWLSRHAEIPAAWLGTGDRDAVAARIRAAALGFSVDANQADQPVSHGPGTELSKLLKKFGIEPTPTCQCRAKAAQMDAWGCDECERPERIEEVVTVMREEAKARGLPFLDAAGRLLVRRAIKLARKNAMDKF